MSTCPAATSATPWSGMCGSGLTAEPKSIPPVYFYDDRGSRLFDEITRLPEYYPTRAERSILDAHARDIAERSGADTLVELGRGYLRQVADPSRRHAVRGQPPAVRPPRRERHHPVGGSRRAADGVSRPGRRVPWSATSTAISINCPPAAVACSPSSGGTIGNLDPAQRRTLPARARQGAWPRTTGSCSAPTWSRTGHHW